MLHEGRFADIGGADEGEIHMQHRVCMAGGGRLMSLLEWLGGGGMDGLAGGRRNGN